ncbi:MAG: M23 family metallopeptidase [Deltaproteobacteria bacterium]|nr:M23 family metallopeptidase [Deltaproteobacteria bacterium]
MNAAQALGQLIIRDLEAARAAMVNPELIDPRHHRELPSSVRRRQSDTAGRRDALADRSVPHGQPVNGIMSSAFGMRRHPVFGDLRRHDGEDIGAPTGAPVHATADGTVRRAGCAGDYGNLVEIDHGGRYVTRYAHLRDFAVTVGQKVRRGDVVGSVGQTGNATGPHLHYEVRAGNNAPRDPREFVAKR